MCILLLIIDTTGNENVAEYTKVLLVEVCILLYVESKGLT